VLQKGLRETLGHGVDVVGGLVGRKQHEKYGLSPAKLAHEKRCLRSGYRMPLVVLDDHFPDGVVHGVK
jgi:hypothetical protein